MSVDGSTAGSGADTIVFAPALTESGGATIALGGTELTITTPIAISGPGADLLTINAQGNSRIFHFDDGDEPTQIEVEISGLTLTGGNAATGGAILSHENLTLTSSTITGNSATANGGGIWNDGTATITDSTISGNSVGSQSGGGIYNSGTANVRGSTIADNSAFIGGGGIYNRNRPAATATISGSTISGNSANVGGGICNTGTGTATIMNSTISGNSATEYGGGIDSNGTATVTGSTITGNSAGDSGGGILSNSTATSIESTIVAGNRLTGGAADDVSGDDFESTSSHNLIGDP